MVKINLALRLSPDSQLVALETHCSNRMGCTVSQKGVRASVINDSRDVEGYAHSCYIKMILHSVKDIILIIQPIKYFVSLKKQIADSRFQSSMVFLK